MNATAGRRFPWTLNRGLVAAALLLGTLAMAGQPARGHRVTIDTQQLATIVGEEIDHVSPAELADWILRGSTDYRLVDLRDEATFAEYHIPTAENVPVAQLPDHGLTRNEKIVLYSDGGIHSAQAWMLLAAQGYRGAYILRGGLEAWRDEVVFPLAPADMGPRDAAAFERKVQIAGFFGGHPRTASAAAADSGMTSIGATGTAGREAPKVAAPAPPAAKRVGAPAKKKKEGC